MIFPAAILEQPAAIVSRKATMLASGPYRSMIVALRYYPRRSHLVHTSRTMSVGGQGEVRAGIGDLGFALDADSVPLALWDFVIP